MSAATKFLEIKPDNGVIFGSSTDGYSQKIVFDIPASDAPFIDGTNCQLTGLVEYLGTGSVAGANVGFCMGTLPGGLLSAIDRVRLVAGVGGTGEVLEEYDHAYLLARKQDYMVDTDDDQTMREMTGEQGGFVNITAGAPPTGDQSGYRPRIPLSFLLGMFKSRRVLNAATNGLRLELLMRPDISCPNDANFWLSNPNTNPYGILAAVAMAVPGALGVGITSLTTTANYAVGRGAAWLTSNVIIAWGEGGAARSAIRRVTAVANSAGKTTFTFGAPIFMASTTTYVEMQMPQILDMADAVAGAQTTLVTSADHALADSPFVVGQEVIISNVNAAAALYQSSRQKITAIAVANTDKIQYTFAPGFTGGTDGGAAYMAAAAAQQVRVKFTPELHIASLEPDAKALAALSKMAKGGLEIPYTTYESHTINASGSTWNVNLQLGSQLSANTKALWLMPGSEPVDDRKQSSWQLFVDGKSATLQPISLNGAYPLISAQLLLDSMAAASEKPKGIIPLGDSKQWGQKVIYGYEASVRPIVSAGEPAASPTASESLADLSRASLRWVLQNNAALDGSVTVFVVGQRSIMV